jgi:hypothetical protein
MRAKAAYRVLAARDHVEVVDIADGEVVLFWDLLPRETRRFARSLREDLHALEAEDFLARWTAFQGAQDLR